MQFAFLLGLLGLFLGTVNGIYMYSPSIENFRGARRRIHPGNVVAKAFGFAPGESTIQPSHNLVKAPLHKRSTPV